MSPRSWFQADAGYSRIGLFPPARNKWEASVMQPEAAKNQSSENRQHERLLWILSAATFLIFFQAYMVAPLIPRLSAAFMVSAQSIGLIVPAYMIPYGVS